MCMKGYNIRIRSVAYDIVLFNCVVKHSSSLLLLVSELKFAKYMIFILQGSMHSQISVFTCTADILFICMCCACQ